MKILVDQNISFRLLLLIVKEFPQAMHIKALGLTNASDHQIFFFARQHGFEGVITQDEDFYSLLLEHSKPPKVIWLRTGNCSTRYLADTILRNATLIHDFLADDSQDCLEIYS